MNPKKKQIVNAALALFIDKGFAQTSIQDIVKQADISKGTFYNYFSSKSECLMAILEFVKEKSDQKRRELAFGKDKQDEAVFVEQIATRMNMNREHKLIALFEAATLTDDEELIAFIKSQHIEEIKWTAKRIAEIYSPGNSQFSLDHAGILIGMIHHLMHIWKLGTDKDIAIRKVITFALNRLKPMIQDQMQKGDIFFPKDWLSFSNQDATVTDLKKQVISHLEELHVKLGKKDENQKKMEYVQFLIDEFKVANPRKYLLESVMMSLTQTVKNTQYEHEVRQISQIGWCLMKQKENYKDC